jgi:hypothetical protein
MGRLVQAEATAFSVSRYYKPRNKILLGLLSGGTLVWFLGIAVLVFGLITKDMLLLQCLGIAFGVRWAIQWFLLVIINMKAGQNR